MEIVEDAAATGPKSRIDEILHFISTSLGWRLTNDTHTTVVVNIEAALIGLVGCEENVTGCDIAVVIQSYVEERRLNVGSLCMVRVAACGLECITNRLICR